jgi:multidrug efflux pump
LRADQSISFQDMQTKLTQIVKIIKRDPAIENVVAFTGGSRAGGGFLFATMKPKSERDSVRDVITRLRPKLARVTGVAAFLSPVQDMRVGGRGGNSSYQYTLKADDPEVLAKAGPALADALKKYPELTDVDVDESDGGAEVYVKVDHDAATRIGVTPQAVDNALYDAFGQRQVATIYSGLNQYHVVMGVAPEFTGSPEALRNVYVPTTPTTTNASTASTATTGQASATANSGAGAVPAATGTTSVLTGSTPTSTTGSGRTSCGPGSAGAARVSRKTASRSSSWRRTPATTSSCSAP